jgi:uncharacterized membrane protein
MGKDVSDVIGTALGKAAREAVGGIQNGRKRSGGGGSLSGAKGIAAGGAAGLGLMALAPLAKHGVSRLAGTAESGVDKLKDASVGKLNEAASGAIDDAKSKVKGNIMDSIPGAGLFSGGDDDDDDSDDGEGGGGKNSSPGAGKGRRMPVQQDMDIGVPLSVVYNQWTQFEEWPKFMHRLKSASQEDETHVKFKAKIWGKSKEFTAEIVEQRPEERIEWKVTDGISHTGVITFHELAPRLTRIEVNVDLEPGSMAEKFARGARLFKRAVRADMARFKAYVLMSEEETGEWRGTIEDGDVKSESSSSGSESGSSGSESGSSGSESGSSGSESGRSRSRSSSSRSRGSDGGSGSSSGSGRGRSRGSSSSRSSGSSRGSRSSSNGSSESSSSGSSGSSRRRTGSSS